MIRRWAVKALLCDRRNKIIRVRDLIDLFCAGYINE